MSFLREPHRRPRQQPWSASEPPQRARCLSCGRSCRDDLRRSDAIWLHSRGGQQLLCGNRWACVSPVGRRISGLSLAASIVFAAGAFVVLSEWNGLVALFDCSGKISSGKMDAIGA
jgi:hypothetical protein